jgi:hypothetical protein
MKLIRVKETDGSDTYINQDAVAFIRNIGDGDCEIFFNNGVSIAVDGEAYCQGIECDLV